MMQTATMSRLARKQSLRSQEDFAALARVMAIATVTATVVGAVLTLMLGGGGGHVIFAAQFPRSGLVTNEFAYYNLGSRAAILSRQWVATSGSLFAREGAGWTGIPDGRAPDPTSSDATDSAVFRLRTRRADFGNVTVSFRLRIDRIVTTARTPARDYDGVHVWLHYQNPDWLYFASVLRRDGLLVIGKKLPTATGGRYADILRLRGAVLAPHKWVAVGVTIRSNRGTVTIRILLNGRLVAMAHDDGTHGPPILRPGRVGIRGDNAEFAFRDFRVSTT